MKNKTLFRIKFIGEISNFDDDNIDIEVYFPDGTTYGATVFTLTNIQKIMQQYRKTGECMNGLYFWASDMIIVNHLTVENISAIIQDLITTKEFFVALRKL